ncbi:MAG TPA: cation diffusion facilitator family transporter [Steroidobacteraceae bacterium]|jgi:cobalt-zinc-cadmium efflux system protein|nr:cation diffusion facilitator family transporter [Steroidobacteraceae bacterium]
MKELDSHAAALRHNHDGGHDHGADHHRRAHGAPATQSKLFWALLFTLACLLVEGIGGVLAGSLALMADAAHMLTDAAALAMSYAAVRAALKPATGRLSYGHHRWQVLAAFVNGLALLVLAVWILFEAAQRLLLRPHVQGAVVASVAVLGLLTNLGAFAVLSKGESNLNVRGALAHVGSDIAGSAAALIAGLVILATGWMPVDPLLSVVVAGLMIRSGWGISRESAHILLEGAPAGLDLTEVEPLLRSAVPELQSIHHVHSWSLADEQAMVTLHATIRDGADPDQCIRGITRELRRRFSICHVTVQIERNECDSTDSCELHGKPADPSRSTEGA